jgi:hypothetical protein
MTDGRLRANRVMGVLYRHTPEWLVNVCRARIAKEIDEAVAEARDQPPTDPERENIITALSEAMEVMMDRSVPTETGRMKCKGILAPHFRASHYGLPVVNGTEKTQKQGE